MQLTLETRARAIAALRVIRAIALLATPRFTALLGPPAPASAVAPRLRWPTAGLGHGAAGDVPRRPKGAR
jgi:hypothetical protein